MNYWIESARESLLETIGCVDVVSLNDTEVRMLTGQPNLARAARQIRALGPRVLVVKQGSYGACMFTDSGFFFVPGYPLETVVDPTGAGDSFAGGFFGYLDSHLESGEITDEVLRRAAVFGSVVASFAIEAFGSERLQTLTLPEIERALRRVQADDELRGATAARPRDRGVARLSASAQRARTTSPSSAYRKLEEMLAAERCVVLDGGVATELQRRGCGRGA